MEASKAGTVHAVLISLSSGAYYGLNAGIISGIGRSIVTCYFFSGENESASAAYQGMLVGSILLGAMAGSLVGVPVADAYGRRRAFQAAAVVGLLVLALPLLESFALMVLIRVAVGVPIGMLCTLCPLYVCEVVPDHIRGAVGTCMQMAIAGMLAVAQFANFLFMPDYDVESDDPSVSCVNEHKWRAQLLLGVVPVLILLVHAFCFLPESPAWEARQAWLDRRAAVAADSLGEALLEAEPEGQDPELASEGQAEDSDLDDDDDDDDEQHVEAITWTELLCTADGLRWTGISVGLAAATMLTGMDAIMFYGPDIIRDAGLGHVTLVTALVIGLWNFACVFIATYLVDMVGRRPLMIVALSGMTCATLVLGLAYGHLDKGSPVRSVLSMSAVMLFIISFEVGPGALFFIMASETFPLQVRPKALPFANFVQWICNILVAIFFPVLNTGLGASNTFMLLAIVCLASTVFCVRALPETKGLPKPLVGITCSPVPSMTGSLVGASPSPLLRPGYARRSPAQSE